MEHTILIADDNEAIRVLIQQALMYLPCRMVTTSNGEGAVRAAETEKPDLILLDINMPGKDGLEVLKELRRNIHTQMIPVILLTGNNCLENKLAGFELGADDYLTKPFHTRELRVRVENLLRRTLSELSANPLTRLPGSPAIEEEVNRRIRQKEVFAFCYVDVDHFKAYNDIYGYARGDAVIQDLASLLTEGLNTLAHPGRFIGHIGGDDFVLVLPPAGLDELLVKFTVDFDQKVKTYYSEEHARQGCVAAQDRQGKESRFPLMSLSVAVVTNENRPMEHYAKVVDVAAEVKRYLKSRTEWKGSVYMKDRRKEDP